MDGHTGGDTAEKGAVYGLVIFTETGDLQRKNSVGCLPDSNSPDPWSRRINQTRGFPTCEVHLLQNLLRLLSLCSTLFTQFHDVLYYTPQCSGNQPSSIENSHFCICLSVQQTRPGKGQILSVVCKRHDGDPKSIPMCFLPSWGYKYLDQELQKVLYYNIYKEEGEGEEGGREGERDRGREKRTLSTLVC